MNYTKGELTTVDVMKEKNYTWLEAKAYIQGIKDSAAPEMYEALKELLYHYRLRVNMIDQAVVNNAKEALAKAEGK